MQNQQKQITEIAIQIVQKDKTFNPKPPIKKQNPTK